MPELARTPPTGPKKPPAPASPPSPQPSCSFTPLPPRQSSRQKGLPARFNDFVLSSDDVSVTGRKRRDRAADFFTQQLARSPSLPLVPKVAQPAGPSTRPPPLKAPTVSPPPPQVIPLASDGQQALLPATQQTGVEEDDVPGLLPRDDEQHSDLEVEDLDVDREEEFWRDGGPGQPNRANLEEDEGVDVQGGEGPEIIMSQGQGQLPSLEDVHKTRIPSHKWPPKGARPDFTRELSTLWGQLADSINDEQLWVKVLIFPRVILPATAPRQDGTVSLASAVKERLRRWRAGEIGQLWQEALATIKEQPKRGRKRKRGDVVADEEKALRKRNADRANILAGEGQFTRAIQALTSAGMAPPNKETLKVMREKHPPASRPMGPIPTTEYAPLSVTPTAVLESATKFKKGTASGPSGLRPEHLRVALLSSTTRRDPALNNLTRLVNQMLAGKVPSQVAPFLCGARLHAANKRDGGLRPVAVGSWQLAAQTSFQMCCQGHC